MNSFKNLKEKYDLLGDQCVEEVEPALQKKIDELIKKTIERKKKQKAKKNGKTSKISLINEITQKTLGKQINNYGFKVTVKNFFCGDKGLGMAKERRFTMFLHFCLELSYEYKIADRVLPIIVACGKQISKYCEALIGRDSSEIYRK